MEKKYLNDSGLMQFWGKIKSYTNSVSDALQGQIDDKQRQITANDEDISLLQTRSTQMEQSINNIAVTGGASVANTVAYSNTASGLVSINAQGAIDELAAKNATKAEKAEVTAELEKKFDKESILQESGDAEDKVMSQKAVSDKLSYLSINTIFNVYGNIDKLNSIITDKLSRLHFYTAIRNIHFINCNPNEKRTLYLIWNGYADVFSFRISRYDETANKWVEEFNYTVPKTDIVGYFVNIEVTNEDKKCIASLDLREIGEFKKNIVLNTLDSTPELIFSNSCYEYSSITAKSNKSELNSRYIISPVCNGENFYSINNIRKNKAILASSPHSILDYAGICITDFIKVPDDASSLTIKGVYNTNDSKLTIRFSKYPNDISESVVFNIENDAYTDKGFIFSVKNARNRFPLLTKYLSVSIYRSDGVINEENLQNVSLSFNSEKNIKLWGGFHDIIWHYGFVKNDGSLVQLSNGIYYYSDFIGVNEGDVITAVGSGSGSVFTFSFYSDANQESIIKEECVLGKDKAETLTFTIKKGIKYVRLTKCTDYASDYYFKKLGYVESSENKIKILDEAIGKYDKEKSYSSFLVENNKIAPKKATICFQMDINSESSLFSDNLNTFVDKLASIGAYPSLFLMSSQLNPSSIKSLKNFVSKGCEVGIHTIPADSIGSTNSGKHPSIAEFKTIVKGYINSFVSKGIYPLGWVTSQGKMVEELVPYLKNYVGYAHTLGNGYPPTDNVDDFINLEGTDRFKIKRWGIELDNENAPMTEQELVDKVITLIDKTIEQNGMIVLYCHSYNLFKGTTYTLREKVLEGILDYISPKVQSGEIITGTTKDMCSVFLTS